MGRRRGKNSVHTGFSGKENMSSCLVVGAGLIKGQGMPSILFCEIILNSFDQNSFV